MRRVRSKTVLLATGKEANLFRIGSSQLGARQTRSYRFDLPDRHDQRVLDLTVTIEFHGTFGAQGNKAGRLSASIFRLPKETDSDSARLPTEVGFAPYEMQRINDPTQRGRIVLLHRPKHRPLRTCGYQIVLGASTPTTYSVSVECRYASEALPIVRGMIEVGGL